MKITIIAIGKKHDPCLLPALEHYTKMLGGSAPEWQLYDTRTTDSKDQTKQAEAKLLLQTVSPDDTVIVLDERGTELTSPQLAQKLETHRNVATKRLVFIIGGAFGLDASVLNRADFVWSLSKLVFPHQIVRLILLEQLYRANSILSSKTYHY